jgi:hypothetical protein
MLWIIHLSFLFLAVAGITLVALIPRPETLRGPRPPDSFVDNGCTFAPDGWWSLACRYHDYHYHLGIIRSKADWWFFQNLLCCNAPRYLACYYFLAVRCFGKRYAHKK